MEHGLNTRDDLQGAHDYHAPHGVGKYVAVFLALCVLTAISFVVGNSQQLRENSPGVMWAMMMAVSCAKAMLVILFFMHVKYSSRLTKVIVGTGFFFLAILFVLTLSDYLTRGWQTGPPSAPSEAATQPGTN